jgi:uncharacterized protein YggU (UPF0235/DUF167 family)
VSRGVANEALIDFLSQSLDIPRRNVCIVSGFSSRNKLITQARWIWNRFNDWLSEGTTQWQR